MITEKVPMVINRVRSTISTFLPASVLLPALLVFAGATSCTTGSEKEAAGPLAKDSAGWQAPDEAKLPHSEEAALIRYGKELVAHTAIYLGPKGIVARLTNGMNCQNCHLNAGRQPYANSYAAVAATYPKLSARSGGAETVERKVNDCMERSLNGKKLDTAGREMKAMVAYIKWVGSYSQPQAAAGGTQQPVLLQRAADPQKGKVVYTAKCLQCHGPDGQGVPSADSSFYVYPPLWGPHSYNVSAGIFRLGRLAGFIKNNMPYGATYKKPQLTNEEAWDVAAFINSQPRQKKMFASDWPVISKKPMDYPFGPYTDSFSEKQHKYGPYGTMVKH